MDPRSTPMRSRGYDRLVDPPLEPHVTEGKGVEADVSGRRLGWRAQDYPLAPTTGSNVSSPRMTIQLGHAGSRGARGRYTANVLPDRALGSRTRRPPCASAIHFAIGSPSPAPAYSELSRTNR